MPFSREDDEHLAEYLAAVIPDEEEGGRGGIEVYRRLVEAGKEASLFSASPASCDYLGFAYVNLAV